MPVGSNTSPSVYIVFVGDFVISIFSNVFAGGSSGVTVIFKFAVLPLYFTVIDVVVVVNASVGVYV